MTLYRVTGTTSFLGHMPGEEFDADLGPDEARRALERGSIKAVKAAANKKEKEEADDA